jgi:hypothetical protein
MTYIIAQFEIIPIRLTNPLPLLPHLLSIAHRISLPNLTPCLVSLDPLPLHANLCPSALQGCMFLRCVMPLLRECVPV